MARSIWRGNISFGLVNVPVKLYSAVSKKTVRFNQLHDADHARIQQKRVCAKDGEEIPFENIVKGFEIAPDSYVVITPGRAGGARSRRRRAPSTSRTSSTSTRSTPCTTSTLTTWSPTPAPRRPTSLLLDALRETNKVAIARVVLRSKEYLIAIRPAGDVLTMETMLFADELIPSERLDELPETTRRDRARVGDGASADRGAGHGVRPDQVSRRVPRAGARPDRAQGGRARTSQCSRWSRSARTSRT